RPRRRHLLLEDVVLDDGRAAPAVRRRPVDADPPAAGQLLLPRAQERDLVLERRVLLHVGRRVRRDPRLQLESETLFGVGERQVHGRKLLARRAPERKGYERKGPRPRSATGGPVTS